MVKKILKSIVVLISAGPLFLAVVAYSNMKNRYPGYSGNLTILNNDRGELTAGFSAVPITPDVTDTWTDFNNDARYNPSDGDTYTDKNANGKFDPVWIAGFSNKRAANGIHDDLWARTIIIGDGKSKLAIVSLDLIGFLNDDVIDVRNMIPAETGISYLIITSTHNHEGPDMLGLWGNSPLKSGIDKNYKKFLKAQIVKSVVSAVSKMEPVILEISEDSNGAADLVKDTREPEVFDPGLRIIRAVSKVTGKTSGSLISWADHPETLWSKNLLITSDFPYFIREGVEKGIYNGDSLMIEGQGGIAIYINGAVGGLMTTHPNLPVKDLFSGKEYKDPSFEKAESQGKRLAMLALTSMNNPEDRIEEASISLISRSLKIPVKNKLFRLGMMMGLFDRGSAGRFNMRTELAVFKIGPVTFATLPGEVYPEIINGGIDAVEGNDFGSYPVEVPPVREMMPGKHKFIIGLANDEIGYIIPNSQWDIKEPFSYRKGDAQYGEENSLGPETAPILHQNIKEMLSELQ